MESSVLSPVVENSPPQDEELTALEAMA